MSDQKSKADLIAERQANLPLPDQPPVASDFNSADARTVNVGSGGVNASSFSAGNDSLRGPSTGDSAVRTDENTPSSNTLGQGVGREGKDGLDGLPRDAMSGGALHGKKAGVETRGEDYGYPQKADPSGKQ